MCRRRFRCDLHLGIARLRSPETDVLPRRGCENNRILRHKGNVTAKCITAHFRQGNAIKSDNTRFRIVETLNHLNNSRFSRARRPNKCDRFTRRNLEAHVLQGGRVRPCRIAERDIFKCNVAAHGLGQNNRRIRVIHRIFRIQQFHQPLGRASSALQLAPDF